MLSCCGPYCCWWCQDCSPHLQTDVSRESSRGGRPSRVAPHSNHDKKNFSNESSVRSGSGRGVTNPVTERTYGTYDEMRAYMRASSIHGAPVPYDGSSWQYDNTVCRGVLQEVDEQEIFYQTVNIDELLERENRQSKVVLETKRISIQPAALYNKLAASTNRNWSLRQQPFFNQLSSNRMSRRLFDPAQDDSFDSNDVSDQASIDSCETYEDSVITRPPSSLSHKLAWSSRESSPASARGLPNSRMAGYLLPTDAAIDQARTKTSRNGGVIIPDTNSVSTDAYTLQQLKDEMADVTAEMETLDGGEDGKNNPKSKQMSIGRKKFNMDPKKGIEYLIEHGLLKNTPDDISKFLYNGEGLNKTAIGDYLGERHDFNQTVLDAFVALHDFTDLILVQALRQFLWSFRLPGEAQKIDRMMERFAGHYCELNPSIFQHPDTCFVLSFAIIMLNTSLHNPAVKDKQTLEQFINMNRGIDNGSDLPRELLESLYESIKTEPFKIPEDDGNDLMHTFFNPDREGWLWKQGGRYKSWKRRWFILNDNCLYYFEYTTDKEPRGIIPLENIEVREVHDRNKPHCFELYATSTDFIKACKTDSEGKVVEGKHTVYRMSAATQEEKEEWIKCIRQSISHNPFYDLLAKRKKNIQKNSS